MGRLLSGRETLEILLGNLLIGNLLIGEQKMKEIYLVTYEHRHGTDHTVVTTQDLAQTAMLEWVREWRAEFEIPEDVTDKQALENWYELTDCTEHLFYDIMPVLTEIKTS